MLTPNEKQISELLNLGNNPKQIAQQRKTSIQAVYKTIKRLKKKGLVIGSLYI